MAYIIGNDSDEIMEGTDGSDRLSGRGGDDVLRGRGGNDRLDGDDGNDVAFGGAGNDRLYGLNGDDVLHGGAGRDTFYGHFGNDVLYGGTGDDWLDGEEGDDRLHGGAGNDQLYYSEYSAYGNDSLFGGPGEDHIAIANNRDNTANKLLTVHAGAGNDFLYSNSYYAMDYDIAMGQGDDVVEFRAAGSARIDLGQGDDVFMLGRVNGYSDYEIRDIDFWLTLGPGRDTVHFDRPVSSVTITDFATGELGDVIDLDRYLDWALTSWFGDNPFDTGHLRLVQSGANASLEVDTDGGGDSWETLIHFETVDAGAFTASSFDGYSASGGPVAGEMLSGTPQHDTLGGTKGDDVIEGLSGNDTLSGLAGGDRVVGRAGDDTLDGGLGDDFLSGGRGDDILLYSGATGHGNDRMLGGAGDDVFEIDTPQLEPGRASLVIDGGAGLDTLTVATGGVLDLDIDMGGDDDLVELRANGAALVHLGAGNDTLWLGTVNGTSAPDPLDIAYRLILGAGQDTVHFDRAGNSAEILDFEAGANGDIIDLDAFLAWGLVDWNSSNPFASGHLRLQQSGADVHLEVDSDGGGDDWQLLVRFADVDAAAFGAANFDGYSPDGGSVEGISIQGTADADDLQGGRGDDTVSGLGGDDTLSGDAGRDLLQGGDGDDSLKGGAGDDELDGGRGDDALNGGAGHDVLSGGEGDDLLIYSGDEGDGNDEMFGGAGADIIEVILPEVFSGHASLLIDSGAGDDQVDIYSETALTVELETGRGNDWVDLWAPGDISVALGGGDDRVKIGSVNQEIMTGEIAGHYLISLGDGGDDLSLYAAPETLTILDFGPSSRGNDSLRLDRYAANSLTDFSGSNPFTSGHMRLVQAGTDTLLQVDKDGGGDAWELLITFRDLEADYFDDRNLGYHPVVGTTNETIEVVAPEYLQEGFSDAFTLGLNFLDAEAGTSEVSLSVASWSKALEGDDVSIGLLEQTVNITPSLTGEYLFEFGSDFSVIDDAISEGVESLILRVEASGQVFENGLDWTAFEIDLFDNEFYRMPEGQAHQDGSPANDYVIGNDRSNIFFGDGGDDVFKGGDGLDWLNGGEDNDTLHGGEHADELNGDEGNDVLYGGTGSDILTGAKGHDELYGQSGDDTVFGGDGDDLVNGAAGADRLVGGDGNDTLNGGAGNDLLEGGAGDDLLNGQAGMDAFIFRAVDAGADTVVGFEAGETVRLWGFGYGDAAEAAGDFVQAGSDVVFASGGVEVTFEDALLADLVAGIETDPAAGATDQATGLAEMHTLEIFAPDAEAGWIFA